MNRDDLPNTLAIAAIAAIAVLALMTVGVGAKEIAIGGVSGLVGFLRGKSGS